MEIINSYTYTVYALLIADFVGIRLKHIPGSTIPSDHSNFLFRASRVVADTNETIAIFILAIIFCVFSSASPQSVAFISWIFFILRFCYAVCYYCNLKILRSVVFGISLLALIALIVIGVCACF